MNENRAAFQDNKHSVPLRTVQQLKGTNARNKIFAPCMQPELLFQGNLPCSFYLLSSSTAPTVRASTPFPSISIIWRGTPHTGGHTNPSSACHTYCQELLLNRSPPRRDCSLPSHKQQHSTGSVVQAACCSHGEWRTICLTSQTLRNHSDTTQKSSLIRRM